MSSDCMTTLTFIKQEKNKVFCQITPELKRLIDDYKKPSDLDPSLKFNKIYIDNKVVKVTVPKAKNAPKLNIPYSCVVSLEFYDFFSEGKRLIGLYFKLNEFYFKTVNKLDDPEHIQKLYLESKKKNVADFTKVEQNYDLNFPVDEPVK